ncbi:MULTISPECIES: hypothetical protein [Bacillus cereus group]|jgi:hypothetical protein|uniref:hypothetical protein n=1 Tax=Bacillus cereus group TaxID=86661 RepID=UPI00032FD9CA|nr:MULTISPECIES: hypothetical protein [Bacillus cereus group]EOO20324.1 hypothetical protein IG9_00507 [Bacillus cereus HuA2-9]
MIKKVKMFLMGIVFIGTVAFGGSQFIQYANRGDTPAPVIPTYTKSSHDSLNLS